MFAPFFAEETLVNLAVQDTYCPLSKEPDYKKTCVSITKVEGVIAMRKHLRCSAPSWPAPAFGALGLGRMLGGAAPAEDVNANVPAGAPPLMPATHRGPVRDAGRLRLLRLPRRERALEPRC